MMLSGLGEVWGEDLSRGASLTGTVVSEEACHYLSVSARHNHDFKAYPALEALGGMYHRNSLLTLGLADLVRYVSLQHEDLLLSQSGMLSLMEPGGKLTWRCVSGLRPADSN